MADQPSDVEVYLLREFLSDQRRLKEKGITLETIYDRVGNLGSDQRIMNSRLNRHGNRLRNLETKINGKVDDDNSEENSKVHHLQELEMARELSEMKKEIVGTKEKREDEEVWWKRQRWIWAGAILLGIFGALISGCSALLIWKITAPH